MFTAETVYSAKNFLAIFLPNSFDNGVKKLVRKTWPKIRVVIVKGETFYQVDARRKGTIGKRETFSSLKSAQSRASEIEADFQELGSDGLALPLEVRASAAKATRILAPYDKTIDEAVSFYLAHLLAKEEAAKSQTVEFLSDEWVVAKKNSIEKKLRKRTLEDIAIAAKQLKAAFAGLRILEVTPKHISDYVAKIEGSNQTRYNTTNRFKQFFNWCIKEGYLTTNPVKLEIEVEEHDPIILTVKETDRLIRLCEAEYKDLLLYHAICLFAGLRPSECVLLRWENILMKEGQIRVKKETSKIKETRLVPIEPNLSFWLNRSEVRTGLVTNPVNLPTRLKKLRKEFCGERKWVPDITRHSYASYWLGRTKDRAHLAENMGTSLKMIKQHYKEAVTDDDAAAYWRIFPEGIDAKLPAWAKVLTFGEIQDPKAFTESEGS